MNVVESPSDLLKILISGGSVNNTPRYGRVSAKEVVSEDKDFFARVRLSKPVVQGVAGAQGQSGLIFSGSEGDNVENVRVSWVVNTAGVGEVVFRSTLNGEVKEHKVNVNANQAELALKRVGDEYIAYYRKGGFDDDNPFVRIGNPISSPNKVAGKVRLFAQNLPNNYATVMARFDVASVNSNMGNRVFVDVFGTSGQLDTNKWGVVKKGVDAAGNNEGVLRVKLNPSADANSKNSLLAMAKAKVPKDQKGVAVAELWRPAPTGTGAAISGILFASEGSVNDEKAAIYWKVENDKDTLVFMVRDGSGKLVEVNSVNVPKHNMLQLRLMHDKGAYTATYQYGQGVEDDAAFKKLGVANGARLGEEGRFGILVTHSGVSSAPAVSARLDSFRINY